MTFAYGSLLNPVAPWGCRHNGALCTRSSVEEQWPSKPLVVGSNPTECAHNPSTPYADHGEA